MTDRRKNRETQGVRMSRGKNGNAVAQGLPNRNRSSYVDPVGKIKKPRKRMTARRIFTAIGVSIVTFSLLAAAGITFLWGYIFSDFTPDEGGRIDIPTQALTNPPPEIKGITNILLIGTDARDPDNEYGLSDTLIILTIDGNERVIKMTSIMRDSYTYIPGREQPNKINAAHAYGGPELALRTVNEALRLNMEYYVSVNMENMAAIIDIAGGIDVEISSAEMRDMNKTLRDENRIESPGLQHLNGTQAVRYARVRKIDSDAKRTERQREILSLLFTVFKDAGLSSKTKMIQKGVSLINTNLTASQITSLGLDIVPKMSSQIEQFRIPPEGYYRVSTARGWHMVLDYNGIIPLLYDFIYGEQYPFDPVPTIQYITSTPAPTSTPEPTEGPEPTVDVTPEVSPGITDPQPSLTPETTPGTTEALPSPSPEISPEPTATAGASSETVSEPDD